jgi:hypothetical protein
MRRSLEVIEVRFEKAFLYQLKACARENAVSSSKRVQAARTRLAFQREKINFEIRSGESF